MRAQHLPLCLAFAAAAWVPGAAVAQGGDGISMTGSFRQGLRWDAPRSALGLQPGSVGKRLGPQLGVFAWAGTTSSRWEGTSLMGGDAAPGTGYGAGLSWDITPRTSATVGWESYELRPGLGTDTVRQTRLGLQWRY